MRWAWGFGTAGGDGNVGNATWVTSFKNFKHDPPLQPSHPVPRQDGQIASSTHCGCRFSAVPEPLPKLMLRLLIAPVNRRTPWRLWLKSFVVVQVALKPLDDNAFPRRRSEQCEHAVPRKSISSK